MPIAGVAAATCLAAGFGSILMGLISNYPLALAPGMGLNAYFAYTVVKGMGVAWETALGCVFLSGVAFLILTALGVRQLIVRSIPRSLFSAVAAGIGLFIAFIGLKGRRDHRQQSATFVGLGDLLSPNAALSLLGLLLIAALQAWKVKGAMLIGILLTLALGWGLGLTHISPVSYSLKDLSGAAFKLDILGALNLKRGLGVALLEIVFVFLFVDLFDNVGTLVAVTKRAGIGGRRWKHSAVEPHPFRRFSSDDGWRRGRNQHRDQLRGKRSGRGRRGTYGPDKRGGGASISLHLIFRAPGAGHPLGGDSTSADPCRRLNDWGGYGGGLGRSHRRDPCLSHHDHDPPHLFHRQRPSLRHHQSRGVDFGREVRRTNRIGYSLY